MSAELLRDGRVTLGCFDVGGHHYAIDVGRIREVVRWQAPTPLPRAPALIEGVVDLRGLVVPVVDLGVVLLGRAPSDGAEARIVLVEVDGLSLGLVVDAAVEVREVEALALDEPPALATHAGYDAVRAIVRRPDHPPILLLSLDHILESVFRSALPSSEVA